jgi:hypothetical protein
MATVLGLASGDAPSLFKLDPGFERGEEECRCFFASEKLKVWIENELPELASPLGVQLTPQQQLFALTEIYCSGETLTFGDHIKPLRSRSQGVWEFRTEDLRIFGWFPVKDYFVGVVGNDATFIKEHDLYAGYIGEVVRFRNQLDLDEPKFIQSEDPRHVVSNYTYP